MRKIGTIKATALVASNMIGSGALLTPALLAPFGYWALIGWVVTTIGALALALCFSKLSIWLPGSGGPYSYVRHVFGEYMGFLTACGYWFSTWCGSASLVIGTLSYLSVFWPEVAINSSLSIFLGLSMIWLFTIINMRGVSESTTVSVFVLIIKIVPLVLFAIIGCFCFQTGNSFKLSELSTEIKGLSLLSMCQPLLWAFMGLESATVPAGQVENPKRTIPIATIAGVLITAAVYIIGTIVIYGVMPISQLAESKAPYADAAGCIAGPIGSWFMIITGLIGLIGSLNGWILIHGQVPYAAAQDGLFPKFFQKTNKHGAPIGVIIGSILMSILFIMSYQNSLNNQIAFLIDISVFAMVLPYFYCVLAVICLIFFKKKEFSLKSKIALNITTGTAFIYSFLAIFSSGKDIIFYGFLGLLLLSPLYIKLKEKLV